MRTFILDAETYYSKEYSLSKMTPAEYILDPQFELTGLAVKELGQQPYWIEGPDAEAFFRELDPEQTTTISHNALFDNCIWSYRYGFVPKLMVCTLGMARALLNIRSNSLAAVAKYFKLSEEKGSEIQQAIGMRLANLQANPQFYRKYQDYALKDARLCEAIYAKMAKDFPTDEYFIQDLVLRAAVQPVLHADTNLLASHLEVLRKRKARLLRESNYDRANLMSTPQFQAALEELGVVVKTKMSPAGREVPAFAKTDPFMEELQEYRDGPNDDVNYRVQVLASARLAHKSTIEETRAERFLSIARLPWDSHEPLLPVPLRYGGAHTHRLSGEWRMNLQNLPRDRTKSSLRSALVAPAGFKIVSADLSQIEARIVACLAGETELIEAFRDGKDVYAMFASRLFGYPVNKKEHPNERFIGKTAILGLGYGCGANRFFQMVTAQSRQYGINLKGLFDADVAQTAVDYYRASYPLIAGSWNTLERLRIKVLCNEKNAPAEFGPVTVSYGRIRLPSGMFLRYEVPDQTLYGAKILENITQALARIVIMDAALRLEDLGYRFVLQAHDELVFVIPDRDVEDAREVILEQMCRVPTWLPSLPLAAEIGVGQNYGETK
jgi:DNA polymerase